MSPDRAYDLPASESQLVVKCIVCERPSGKTNHWFEIRMIDMSGSGIERTLLFQVGPVDEGFTPGRSYVCGQECACKELQRYMGSPRLKT